MSGSQESIESVRKGLKREQRLLTAQELAAALNVPLSWVREKTMRKEIPHEKLGKYARYDLNKVLEHFAVQPASHVAGSELKGLRGGHKRRVAR